MLFGVLMVWGSVFSLLAGLVACLISFNEMRHHYHETKEPLRQALQTGTFTFLFFMAITLALAFELSSIL